MNRTLLRVSLIIFVLWLIAYGALFSSDFSDTHQVMAIIGGLAATILLCIFVVSWFVAFTRRGLEERFEEDPNDYTLAEVVATKPPPMGTRPQVILLVLIVLTAAGWIVDFAPSTPTIFVATIMALGMAWLGWRYLMNVHAFVSKALNKSDVPIRIKSICAALTVLVFSLTWISVAHGVAGTLTHFYGSEITLDGEFEKKTRSGGRRVYSCKYRIEGEALSGLLPDHICIPTWMYEKTGNRFRLIGKKNVLGVVYLDVKKFK